MKAKGALHEKVHWSTVEDKNTRSRRLHKIAIPIAMRRLRSICPM
jgi:hypothetical protein